MEVVSREKWGATPPKFKGRLSLPISNVVLDYTWTPSCDQVDTCAKQLREIQKANMVNSPDIRYSFLIDEAGRIYEGRGWQAKPGLPGRYRDMNYTTLYIAYIGQSEEMLPKKIMWEAKNAFVRSGMDDSKIEKNILEFYLDQAKYIQMGKNL